MSAHAKLPDMNVSSRISPMTLEQFLEWEERQEVRYEFDGARPVAMTGGTANHAFIQRNLSFALHSRLRGKPCQFVPNDLKVQVAGRIRYPDGYVVCTPVAPKAKIVTEPVVIFEVLSDGTASQDRITKNHEYASTPSVRRYVMLEQDRIGATVFARVDDDWSGRVLQQGSVLHMPEIGIEVPLAELYEGITFEADGTDGR